MSVLGSIIVPCVCMAIVAVLMLIYANKLSWLIVY